MKQITSKEAKIQFNGYYSQILGAMSSCFRKARLLPLDALRCENPSFLDIADELQTFYKSMEALNNGFFDVEHKISEKELSCIQKYVELLKRLGQAIDIEDIEEMTEVVATLAEEPYI